MENANKKTLDLLNENRQWIDGVCNGPALAEIVQRDPAVRFVYVRSGCCKRIQPDPRVRHVRASVKSICLGLFGKLDTELKY